MKNALLLVGTFVIIGAVACGPQGPLTEEGPDLLTDTESELTVQSCTPIAPISVISSGSESVNPARNAMDDRLDTRWSNLGSGSWIDFDLGRVYTVGGLAVAWHMGSTQFNSFTISTSPDGMSYTQVYTGMNTPTLAAETYKFSGHSARRVRITVFGNNLNDWASIAEVRGCAGSVSTPPSSSLVWNGDFETGSLSQWHRAQGVAADRLQVVSSPARQGGFALKATVKYGDNPIGSSGNRNEVVRLTNEPEGSEYYYRWSTMFAPDFPAPATWQLFTQWHHSGTTGSPPVEFAVNNNNIILYCSKREVWRTPLVRGAWQDFIFHVKWSPNASVGFMELTLNGKQVLPKKYCATQFPGMTQYLKVGLYRSSSITQTGVVYHDNWAMGRSLSDVMQ
jgi:hypothetical protein